MRRSFFWFSVLLIIAPAYAGAGAGEKDFADFLKDYIDFKARRDADSASHMARFTGKLVFRESECAPSIYADGPTMPCDCPPGNNYLQCLVSAQAVIKADQNDYGGRGYVMIQASDGSSISVLNQYRQWVPMTQFRTGSYSAIMNPITETNVIDIPVPTPDAVWRACSGGAKSLTLTVGYGAVMPMDTEFARRMKERSVDLGQKFDEEAFIWSRARINGFRPKKAGEIGTVTCRPVAGS